MSDVVITLSSDEDEFVTPPLKKFKSKGEVIFLMNGHEEKAAKIKSEEDSVTIIIDDKPSPDSKKEINNCNVVVISDDPDESEFTISTNKCSTSADPLGFKSSVEPKKDGCTKKASDRFENNNCDVTNNLLNNNGIPKSPPEKEREDIDSMNNSSEEPLTIVSKIEEMSEKDVFAGPSTSSESYQLLEQFLRTCADSIGASPYEDKLLPKFFNIRKRFRICQHIHNSKEFEELLKRQINDINSPASCVVSFQKVYSYLGDHLQEVTVEVPPEKVKKIKKLEKMIKILIKRIKKLEDIEVDFDDESNSSYLQLDRYTQRLNKVHEKYCQLLNKNPKAGRLIYDRISFSASKYEQVNKAVMKTYKHNKFPSYEDIEKCIRKAVAKHDLKLNENDVKFESKFCFEKLGKMLQCRRQRELYDSHSAYVENVEDPALKNPELNTKLKKSVDEGSHKIKELIEKYVRMQETNVQVELSEDSDDSHYQESESGDD